MKRPRHRVISAGLVCAVAAVLCAPADAGTQWLMIPAASFSADGTAPWNYVNYGDRLETTSGAALAFHAWLKLPNAARIVNVDLMTRDNDPGTITLRLKRSKFGFDDTAETLLTFTSPGNLGCSVNGLCHDMASQLSIYVDAANYSYWFDLHVPDAGSAATELSFWAVRVGYDVDDVVFADTFESTTTEMWDATSSAKSVEGQPALEPRSVLSEEERQAMVEELLSTLHVEDPLAHEALEKALKGVEGYGSPLVVPGPAFKNTGYTEYDDYYLSESYGFVYGRPGENGAIMSTGLNLPDGAVIQFYMAFFRDSVPDLGLIDYQDNIRFWLTRLHTWDRSSVLHMVYRTSSGADNGIRSISVTRSAMEAVQTGCTTVDNSQFYYWLTLDVGPYELAPPPPYSGQEWWHKVYAVVILYTMP